MGSVELGDYGPNAQSLSQEVHVSVKNTAKSALALALTLLVNQLMLGFRRWCPNQASHADSAIIFLVKLVNLPHNIALTTINYNEKNLCLDQYFRVFNWDLKEEMVEMQTLWNICSFKSQLKKPIFSQFFSAHICSLYYLVGYYFCCLLISHICMHVFNCCYIFTSFCFSSVTLTLGVFIIFVIFYLFLFQ